MKRILFVFALGIALPFRPVQAENGPLTFNALLKEAFVSSPEAAKIDSTLAERAGEAFEVQVKQNPILSGQAGIPSDREVSTELSLTLSQSIRPSDFGERSAVARLIEETAGIDKLLALNEFVQTMRVIYARAWQAQEREKQLEQARSRSQQVLKKVSEGASRGIFPESDVELFKAELKILEAEVVAAEGDSAVSRSELSRLSGTNLANRPLDRFPNVFVVSREELERMVRESKLPTQRRYELLSRLAEKQLEVARLDSLPAVSPQVGYGRTDEGADQLLVGFSIPLPFFDRNQGEIRRAQGALAAAETGKRYATSDAMVGQALLLFDAVDRLRRQVDLYETGVLPAKKRALDAYYRQFDAGLGTPFQLWQTQREMNEVRLKSLDLQSTLAGALAQLNALVGQQQF